MRAILEASIKEMLRLKYWITAIILTWGLAGLLIGRNFPVFEARTYVHYHALGQDRFRQASFSLSDTAAVRSYFEENAPYEAFAKPFLRGGAGDHFKRMVAQVYPPPRQAGEPSDRRSVVLVISTNGPDADTVEQQVLAMVNCVTDTLLLTGLGQLYLSQLRKYDKEVVDTQASLTKQREDVKSLLNRINGMRELAIKYPEYKVADARQIVDVRGESSRFVPLPQQIVAAESTVVDTIEAVRRTEQSLEQSRLLREYYSEAHKLVQQPLSGQKLMHGLEKVRAQVFTKERLASANGVDALNAVIDAEKQQAFEVSALPVAVDRYKKVGISQASIFGLAGGLASTLLLLTTVIAWRHSSLFGTDPAEKPAVSQQ